jgi:hypothetical protein
MLLAFLLYVTLDLSLPGIPGAFVFETSGSLEISGGRVGENKPDAAVLPVPARNSVVVSQPPVDLPDRLTAISTVALLGHPTLNRLPRATLDPAPPSEDPH